MYLKKSHIRSLWLVLIISISLSDIVTAQISPQEKAALLDMYEYLDGHKWNNKWILDDDVTNWHGVKVIDDKVVELNLFNNNLVGVLPESIGYLKHLTHLNLAFNGVTGQLPKQLINMTALKVLKIEMNRINIRMTLFKTFGEFQNNPFGQNIQT